MFAYIVIYLEVSSSGNDLVPVTENSLKLNAAIDNPSHLYQMCRMQYVI